MQFQFSHYQWGGITWLSLEKKATRHRRFAKKNQVSMVADLRHAAPPLPRHENAKSENTNIRQSQILSYFCVFAFWMRKNENTTNKMCRIFASYLSCLYIFAYLLFHIFKFLLFRIVAFFAFSHCCVFAFSLLCILVTHAQIYHTYVECVEMYGAVALFIKYKQVGK